MAPYGELSMGTLTEWIVEQLEASPTGELAATFIGDHAREAFQTERKIHLELGYKKLTELLSEVPGIKLVSNDVGVVTVRQEMQCT